MKPGERVEYHWFTLAEGTFFYRKSDADEALAAIWYEIESLLSSAFGAATTDMKRDKLYAKTRGWPWQKAGTSVVEFEWRGLDGHSATMDSWAPRSSDNSEDGEFLTFLERKARRNKIWLKQHQQEALDNETHKCEELGCSRVAPFKTARELESHQTLHDEEKHAALLMRKLAQRAANIASKRYLCDVDNCTAPPFSRSDVLAQHKERIHGILKEGTVSVIVAAKALVAKNIANGRHCCTIKSCPRSTQSFSSQQSLDAHMASHAAKPTMKFSDPTKRKKTVSTWYHCRVLNCKFKGRSAKELRDHDNVHTGARPYKCKKCSKGFTQRCNASKHEKTCKGI